MLTINPYLHFRGKAEEAMNFYKSVLGGEFTILSRYKDLPGGEKMPPEQQQKMIHISLTVANGGTLMATDILDSMEHQLVIGNNIHICIHTKSEAETEKIFNALAAGGRVGMPLNKTFWGAYFGMCTDKYDVQWMINYTQNQ